MNFKNNKRAYPSMDVAMNRRYLCRKSKYNRVEGYSREQNLGKV